MKKKMILTLIAALTISSLQAYPGQKFLEKLSWENKIVFLGGYVSGAISGTFLLARWLKNKYQEKRKDVKDTIVSKAKDAFLNVFNG